MGFWEHMVGLVLSIVGFYHKLILFIVPQPVQKLTIHVAPAAARLHKTVVMCGINAREAAEATLSVICVRFSACCNFIVAIADFCMVWSLTVGILVTMMYSEWSEEKKAKPSRRSAEKADTPHNMPTGIMATATTSPTTTPVVATSPATTPVVATTPSTTPTTTAAATTTKPRRPSLKAQVKAELQSLWVVPEDFKFQYNRFEGPAKDASATWPIITSSTPSEHAVTDASPSSGSLSSCPSTISLDCDFFVSSTQVSTGSAAPSCEEPKSTSCSPAPGGPKSGSNGKIEASQLLVGGDSIVAPRCCRLSVESSSSSVSETVSARCSISSSWSTGTVASCGGWGSVSPSGVPAPSRGGLVLLEYTATGMMAGDYFVVHCAPVPPKAVWGDRVLYSVKCVGGSTEYEVIDHIWCADVERDMPVSSRQHVENLFVCWPC